MNYIAKFSLHAQRNLHTQIPIFLPALWRSSAESIAFCRDVLSTVWLLIRMLLSTYQYIWYNSVSSAAGVKEQIRLTCGSYCVIPAAISFSSFVQDTLWKETWMFSTEFSTPVNSAKENQCIWNYRWLFIINKIILYALNHTLVEKKKSFESDQYIMYQFIILFFLQYTENIFH